MDYAIKKDRSSSPPKYLVFFKGRDADVLTAAFTEYTNKKVKQAERQPLLQRLRSGTGSAPAEKPQPGGRTMSNVSLKKRLIPWIPYVLIGLFATNLGEALASGIRHGRLSKAAGTDGLHPPGLCHAAAELPPL